MERTVSSGVLRSRAARQLEKLLLPALSWERWCLVQVSPGGGFPSRILKHRHLLPPSLGEGSKLPASAGAREAAPSRSGRRP